MKNGLSFRRIPTGPYPGKMSFASEEERQSAAKLLEEDNDPGPSKTGIGGSTPKVKKKQKTIKKIRESWRTPTGALQGSRQSGVSSGTPTKKLEKSPADSKESQISKKVNVAGASEETQDKKIESAGPLEAQDKKNEGSAVSKEAQHKVDLEELGPEMELDHPSAASSTPKSTFASNIEGMHKLILGNETVLLETSSISGTPTPKEKSKLDGPWDVTKYKSGKAAGRARRQAERRKRQRERAELTASGSAQPDPKKQKGEATASSSENTDIEPEKPKYKNTRYAQYVPGGVKPTYAEMVDKNDLVCRVISKDRTRSLNDADFGYVSTAYNVYLDRNVAIADLKKLQCKAAGFHDGQIRLCMVSQAGGELLEKVVRNMKPKKGQPEMEFLPPGEEPFAVYKIFSSNLSPRLEGGLERFIQVIRGFNPELNVEGSSIVARIAKYMESKDRNKSPFLVLMIRVSRDLVPIIQRRNFMLNYTFGPLILHVRADPAAPLESDEKATEQMEIDKAKSLEALSAPSK